jgi:hypothetical protein
MTGEKPSTVTGTVVARAFATLLVVAGLILAAGGAYLLKMSGSPYYVIAGIAIAISGVLLWRLRAAGARLYAVVVIVTIAWALWEVGIDGWALMPRVAALLLGGLVLLIPTVRRSLIRSSPAWSCVRIAVLTAAAVVIGSVLHRVLPPTKSQDPMYQAGVAPLSTCRRFKWHGRPISVRCAAASKRLRSRWAAVYIYARIRTISSRSMRRPANSFGASTVTRERPSLTRFAEASDITASPERLERARIVSLPPLSMRACLPLTRATAHRARISARTAWSP